MGLLGPVELFSFDLLSFEAVVRKLDGVVWNLSGLGVQKAFFRHMVLAHCWSTRLHSPGKSDLLKWPTDSIWASQMALMVKNLLLVQIGLRDGIWSLGQEDLLEEGMATYSSILAWRIPWTEDPGRLQFLGSHKVVHDWSDLIHSHTHRDSNWVLNHSTQLSQTIFFFQSSGSYRWKAEVYF